MRKRIGIVATVAALAAASVPCLAVAATASTKALNVCSLSTATAATAIAGISSKCANAASLPGPGSTQYSATWAGKSKGESLMVTVSSYTDDGALALAKRNLNQGFPGGKPSKLSGVGDAAYEVSAAGTAAIHFNAGSDIVYLSLTMTGSTPKVSPSLLSFAKAIAGKITPAAKSTSSKTTTTASKTTTTVSSSLSGSWTGSYSGTFSGTFSLTWQLSGSHLSGTIRISSFGTGSTNVTGAVQGNTITFGTVGSQAIEYTGTFSGSTMSGSWSIGSSGSGSWSAHKS